MLVNICGYDLLSVLTARQFALFNQENKEFMVIVHKPAKGGGELTWRRVIPGPGGPKFEDSEMYVDKTSAEIVINKGFDLLVSDHKNSWFE